MMERVREMASYPLTKQTVVDHANGQVVIIEPAGWTLRDMAALIKVTIEKLAPENGTFLTPVWFGIHDGSFDLFDIVEPASEALEHIAEDDPLDAINQTFADAEGTVTQGDVFGADIPPIAPGTTTSTTFTLNKRPTSSLYFSYAFIPAAMKVTSWAIVVRISSGLLLFSKP
jgi:hypothetical protein